jgi:hypothetical protein
LFLWLWMKMWGFKHRCFNFQKLISLPNRCRPMPFRIAFIEMAAGLTSTSWWAHAGRTRWMWMNIH